MRVTCAFRFETSWQHESVRLATAPITRTEMITASKMQVSITAHQWYAPLRGVRAVGEDRHALRGDRLGIAAEAAPLFDLGRICGLHDAGIVPTMERLMTLPIVFAGEAKPISGYCVIPAGRRWLNAAPFVDRAAAGRFLLRGAGCELVVHDRTARIAPAASIFGVSIMPLPHGRIGGSSR